MNKHAYKFAVLVLTVLAVGLSTAQAEPSNFGESVKQAGRDVGSAAREGGHAVAQTGREIGRAFKDFAHTIATSAKSAVREVKHAGK